METVRSAAKISYALVLSQAWQMRFSGFCQGNCQVNFDAIVRVLERSKT